MELLRGHRIQKLQQLVQPLPHKSHPVKAPLPHQSHPMKAPLPHQSHQVKAPLPLHKSQLGKALLPHYQMKGRPWEWERESRRCHFLQLVMLREHQILQMKHQILQLVLLRGYQIRHLQLLRENQILEPMEPWEQLLQKHQNL